MSDAFTIDDRLQRLAERSQSLASLLRESARELRDPGRAVPADLVERLSQYRTDFRECQSQLSMSDESSLVELQQRSQRLEAIRPHLDLLNHIRRIEHQQTEKTDLVVPIREEAAKMVATLQADPTDATIQTFTAASHPLQALLRLLQAPDDIDDEAWEESLQIVSTTFGRSVGVAAARGHLILEVQPDD